MKNKSQKKSLGKQIWEARYIYLMLLPGIIWFVVWCYMPMDGVLLAFKNYNARLGILGSEWVGLKNFRRIFITPKAMQAIVNTLQISFTRILIEFPLPIILAILINEVRSKTGKKVVQTIYTFPHFFSWVVIACLMSNLFSSSGLVNEVLNFFGVEDLRILADKTLFRPLLYMTSIWKEVGWSAIIYLATISGIDPTLYEAAEIDGANRFQQALHITLPGLKEIIIIQLILSIGGVMNAGFDQIFNLRNGAVQEVADIIDTYVYDITFGTRPNYGFSAAVGVFKSLINMLLMFTANAVCRKTTDSALIK